ncbi:MAG: MFS transporter [Chloroflexi bacterium]|jgi:DHA3 family multidrug efflux protein-like MFS transporter|nr:MFS transporter [Chloroflexota bacterium]
MKNFYSILVNSLVAAMTNNFVWFAVTFWVFLETRSVIATSIMAGIFTTTVALSGFFLGSLVDRYPKKKVMLFSSVLTLLLFALAAAVFITIPPQEYGDASSLRLWAFIVLVLVGAITGNMRGIALSTLVTIMIPEDTRDRANGMVGTAMGVSFLAASVSSGLAVGFLGMTGMLASALILSAAVILHLWTIPVPDLPPVSQADEHPDGQPAPASTGVDLRGTLRVINQIPGLLALIFFQTFNNFLGGIFMSLMDAYGLMLVSVQVWGTLWGILSLGFILGGLIVARRGLGDNPLRSLLLANLAMWTSCIFFTIQPSIILLTVGLAIWIILVPVVEAAEQTVLQKIVPPERQGRVFGFAQSVEQAASPVTSFLIGPVAQILFIPFMTTGAGVDLLGSWFGTGTDRGLALLFTIAGLIGFIVTVMALRSRSYRLLSTHYQEQEVAAVPAMD